MLIGAVDAKEMPDGNIQIYFSKIFDNSELRFGVDNDKFEFVVMTSSGKVCLNKFGYPRYIAYKVLRDNRSYVEVIIATEASMTKDFIRGCI